MALNLPVRWDRRSWPAQQLHEGRQGPRRRESTSSTRRDQGRAHGSTIYCNDSSQWLFSRTISPSVGLLQAHDIIVIVSRNGGTNNTWSGPITQPNFYTLAQPLDGAVAVR
jgi:hypothetical protein